ncbi:MAG: aminotransferase class V-fold PLP-dependent enzyme, partial [Candidatus Aminicenantes bacterium]|nr:aminotransferase class V-fold PLP-dependent enzyme [Candidatus Aminicenantes bacterium]
MDSIRFDAVTARFRDLQPEVRKRFPQHDRDSTGNRRTYLNSGAGSLTVDTAIAAMSEAARNFNPMPGAVSPGELATGSFHQRVRELTADFIHAAGPAEISFHFSATAALFALAFGLRDLAAHGGNVIVTDLDHMANISPWETVWGGLCGCEVRRARITEGGTLDIDHLLSLVDSKTALVATTLASNAFGTVVPVRELTAAVKTKNEAALVCVDAVHHALHGPVDAGGLGCDALVFSGYKVFGPMLGVLWVRGELGDRAAPYRVETNKPVSPWKFELGMLNNANLAALEAALEYLLWLEDRLFGRPEIPRSRPARFRSVMEAISVYESTLSRRVLEGFRGFDPGRFRAYGPRDSERTAE